MSCATFYSNIFQTVPIPLILFFVATTCFGITVLTYLILFIAAPIPTAPSAQEKTFCTIEPDGRISDTRALPCWYDAHNAQKSVAQANGAASSASIKMEEPELFMSLVVPAYNEEDRLGRMLAEAVEHLEAAHGSQTHAAESQLPNGSANGSTVKKTRANGKTSNGTSNGRANGHTMTTSTPSPPKTGWEILVISDGSTDKTIPTALSFANSLGPPSCSAIRVVHLRSNRGKGGAVVHGLRHVRGRYAVFADADGASKFSDLGKLVRECERVEDERGRGVAVGSRAHLVGSEAVVKRSRLRNLLMHTFHLLLRLLTPPATAAIRDTQCGFKLLSRAALPDIVPYMHSEGWIFDVEMLMLAEAAGIPVAEVPVGWKEVTGSKLNVVWDSLGMAWGLAVLRACWAVGIWRRA